MMWYAGSALAFWTICGVLSKLTREDRAYVDSPRFIVGSLVALFLGFSILVGGAGVAVGADRPMGAGLVLAGFVPGVVLLIPWLWHVLGLAAHEAGRAAMGIDTMIVKRTYDAAEKLMHERKFEEAERAFLAEAEKEIGDPLPLRRAGDAALAEDRPEAAVGHFRRALERIELAEDRATLAIRISEIQQSKLGRKDEARRTLQELLPRLGTTRTADLLRERINRMSEDEPGGGGRLDRPHEV